MRFSKNEMDLYREIVDRYRLLHGKTVVDILDVIKWAKDHGELELPRNVFIEHFRPRFSEALRARKGKTSDGRSFRTEICVKAQSNGETGKPVERWLWAHVDEAPDEMIITSFRQRMNAVKADVVQLKNDLDYVNLRRCEMGKRPIQLNFNDIIADDGDEGYGEAGH